MKHVSLTILVIALMSSMVAFAKDAAAPPSVDLKLSKTLTLKPSGSPPVVDTPVTSIDSPTASLEDTGSALPWAALLALLALPAGYWLGLRKKQSLVETTLASEQNLNEQVLTLKDALTESGSGPRNEWQSSLTSMQSELREKSKYIDQMHDQSTANTQKMAELEDALQHQVELTEGLNTEHQATVNERVGKIQQELNEEKQTFAQKLEQQTQLAQQHLDEQSKLGQQALNAKSEEMQKRLDEHSSETQLQLDNLESLNKSLSAERDTFNIELEQSEAALALISRDHDRVTTELESVVLATGPQTAQIKQLSSELDELKTSNDISVTELKKYLRENEELSQSLEQTREESQRLQILLNQEKQEAKEHLVTAQKKFSASLEAEQLAFSQNSNQQVEEIKRKAEGLNKALEDRDRDLAVLIEKVAAHESTEAALDELKQTHTATLAELSAKTEHVVKLEKVLKKSKVQLDQLEITQLELNKKEAELAQIQSIAVDTEQALNEARSALSEQSKALDQQAQSKKSVDTETTARLQEIKQLKAQLASVTERAKHETQRANETQKTRQALEEKLSHQEQDTALLLDNLKTLESEHARQSRLVSTLESSVEQLESDLSAREEENTHTMKQLAQVADHTADLEAKIESSGLLDSHIQELESQLVSEEDLSVETFVTQKLPLETQDMQTTELQHELKALKLTLNNQTQTNDHLKKTLDQARKYRKELEENTRDLERENRDLSKAGKNSRQELQNSNQALHDSVQKISRRDQKLQELQNALDSTTEELVSSKTELGNVITKVDELTTSVALMESNTDEANTRELGDKLERTRKELNQSAQLLSETKTASDELERNTTALQEQLTRSQEQLEKKKEQTNTLGTQLLELSEQRDRYLETIDSLQQALDANPPTEANSQKPHATAKAVAPDEDHEHSMRARENIIAALEHELHNADIKIAGLNQKLEDFQLATRAETREDEPDNEPISATELEKLNLALMNKTRLIQALSNDVKVNRDLVKVFENDSNMLHDTEVKLESLEEHSQFLEHELAKAVTENKTLKSEIEKAAKRLARHQNIGRTVSENTRLEQLKSRLNLLESENRQQLEVIAQLRDQQGRPG